ncbi:MAG: site-specific integrase [Flavobacterium sp.]|nr:site-specific integrase [Flavobacterium sp.]
MPKIFTGGVDISAWNKLNEVEKKKALDKSWYIFYSFRDAETSKLKRMPNIKGGANRFKTKTERLNYLSMLRDTLEFLLEQGFNPYEDNDLTLLNEETQKIDKSIKEKTPTQKEVIAKPIEVLSDSLSIKDAFDFALKIKKNSVSDTTYNNFELRIRKFKKSLDETKPITYVTKKVVNDYLNTILNDTSARNRNNTRTDLSSLFQVLEDNEIISENIIKKINVLKSNPERNKTYTPEMQKDIYDHLEKNDPLLLLFIKFVCYNFLRPVEVCRLRIKDIDLIDKKLYLKTKNKKVKIKIIPKILIDDLPDLSVLNPEHYLFTPTGLGNEWEATENNRRDNFSKRFKEVVKVPFKLGIDYGMYSFRHTFITKLYRELRKNHSQFETKSMLMLITGHATMTALDKYLRDIDAELPEDYSHLLE